MSDSTTPSDSPDATPTQALQLGDQQPVAPPPAAAATPARGGHTRTILEVVGGVVAIGLIFVAGAVGFLVGHATGSQDDGPWRMMGSNGDVRQYGGPDAEGPFGGPPGLGTERGDGRRGPGQGFGQGPGQGQGFGQGEGDWMMPGQGEGPGSMMDEEPSAEPSQG